MDSRDLALLRHRYKYYKHLYRKRGGADTPSRNDDFEEFKKKVNTSEFHWKIIGDNLGKGSYGDIKSAKPSNISSDEGILKKEWVAKVIKLTGEQTGDEVYEDIPIEDVYREFYYAYHFSNLKIGPELPPDLTKCFYHDVEQEEAYYIMEQYDGDILNLERSKVFATLKTKDLFSKDVWKNIESLIRKMVENSIICADIKPQNVLYKVLPNGDVDIRLTDFGGDFCNYSGTLSDTDKEYFEIILGCIYLANSAYYQLIYFIPDTRTLELWKRKINNPEFRKWLAGESVDMENIREMLNHYISSFVASINPRDDDADSLVNQLILIINLYKDTGYHCVPDWTTTREPNPSWITKGPCLRWSGSKCARNRYGKRTGRFMYRGTCKEVTRIEKDRHWKTFRDNLERTSSQ